MFIRSNDIQLRTIDCHAQSTQQLINFDFFCFFIEELKEKKRQL